MNKKGFLLIDSLVNIIIVSILCTLCLMSYQNVSSYYDGYDLYKEETNSRYEEIYSKLGVCEKCIIEEDPSVSEV